jgi:hypothetical protein
MLQQREAELAARRTAAANKLRANYKAENNKRLAHGVEVRQQQQQASNHCLWQLCTQRRALLLGAACSCIHVCARPVLLVLQTTIHLRACGSSEVHCCFSACQYLKSAIGCCV